MSVYIRLSIRFGPMAHLEISGANCSEINEALRGYGELNDQLDKLCTDLAARVYPEDATAGKTAEAAAHKAEDIK